MEVTVDDEAKTEVRQVYTLSAPITGKVLRISPPLHVGDHVFKDETVLAVMQPTSPSFHRLGRANSVSKCCGKRWFARQTDDSRMSGRVYAQPEISAAVDAGKRQSARLSDHLALV
jgi:hypothetical protein